MPRRRRRRHSITRSAGVWLATLSTVVGIATGMFALRDQVFPRESGRAEASLPVYQESVGEVCSDVNEAERARVRDARRLARRLRVARTAVAQRDALLDSVRLGIAAGGHQLGLLEGLDAPPELAELHRATATAWSRNIALLRVYAHRLDATRDRRQLLGAIEILSRSRPALGRNGVTVRAGLARLGGGRCRLDPPIVERTITLPGSGHGAVTPAVNPARTASPGSIAPGRLRPRGGGTLPAP